MRSYLCPQMRENVVHTVKFQYHFTLLTNTNNRVIEIKYVPFKFIPFLHPIVATILGICLRFQSRKIVPFRKDFVG
jgi:hypothetical protein